VADHDHNLLSSRTARCARAINKQNYSGGDRLRYCRCTIFIGSFTLNTAVAIAEEEGMTQNDLAEAIESFVDKSMVEARVDTHEASYTLLATTRAYAFEKLIHSGEHDAIAARHAYFLSDRRREDDCLLHGQARALRKYRAKATNRISGIIRDSKALRDRIMPRRAIALRAVSSEFVS
jgi:predicted ATPase